MKQNSPIIFFNENYRGIQNIYLTTNDSSYFFNAGLAKFRRVLFFRHGPTCSGHPPLRELCVLCGEKKIYHKGSKVTKNHKETSWISCNLRELRGKKNGLPRPPYQVRGPRNDRKTLRDFAPFALKNLNAGFYIWPVAKVCNTPKRHTGEGRYLSFLPLSGCRPSPA